MNKEFKNYYRASNKPEVVDFESIYYLTIEGKGEPAGKEFVTKVEALYPLAYGVKKECKEQGSDFGVPKLEGLWWVEGDIPALEVPRNEWHWKLLIRMPEFVTKNIVASIQPEVFKKKKNDLIMQISFEEIEEGKCAQVMHIGPYSTEHKTVTDLLAFVESSGMSVNGHHHEIYLSDPRKTPPEKMKTIIRYPVK